MDIHQIVRYAAVLLLGVIIGSICCIRVDKPRKMYEANPIGVEIHDYQFGNMHYQVFVTPQGDITTINVTKDSLLVSKITHDRHQD